MTELLTISEVQQKEARPRRAIDGVAEAYMARAYRGRIYRIADWILDRIPGLLMLAGGVCFLVAVWGQGLLVIGCLLLIAGTVLNLVG